MTIKEVEQMLDVPRATIRFYEKEKLIRPERSGNSYREYSEEDVAALKKIVILRKIGMPVSDIKELLGKKVSLQDMLSKNIVSIEEQMRELEGALKVCKVMQSNNEDIGTFDENYYWEEIRTEEKAGNKFLEIINDVVKFEKNVIFEEFGIADSEGNLICGPKEAALRAFGLCVFAGFVWFFFEGMKWEAFVEGFFWPFVCIIISSVFGLPLYFLGKKHPKAAEIIKKIGIGIVIAFVVVIFGIFIIDKISK